MSPFRVGETLIAGRYRLLRFIAQGGMGEVYEAFDEELRQRVAMKVVRRDVAANPVAMERFKREISLARRVTHPNVSRIFEYGRHTDGDGAVTFLTMELLEGMTLEERIRADGPLTPREAGPIVEQMCEGLAAAHDAGVVHRDLKSSNVMLVRSPEGGVRVVLTDFGLARALTGDDAATVTLTATDLMVGTPAYMSPEQAQGTQITARSDLYSLGVVLFEMVTGAFPHAGVTPMAILMNRLKEPPPSPLAVMPTLDPAWDGVIRRCLEVRPERRFESARDIARALHGEPVAPPPPLTPAEMARETASALSVATLRRRARRRWIAGGVAAALLVGATLALVLLPGGKTSQRGGRRSAAVLGFKNLSGRPDVAWLSTALSEMLTAELGAGEQLRTVPGETVARAKAELAVPDTDALAPATLARLGSLVGTDLVVLGSFFTASADPASALRVDLRVQDASGRGRDAVLTETGTAAEILKLVSSLGSKLRTRLEVPEASPAQVQLAHASFPESAEAQRLYAEGLSRLRGFDPVTARKLLAEAADAAPKSAMIRSALASCYAALGDDARATDAAQTAFDLSASLSREERLLIEAQLAEAKREWPKAVEDYRALWRFFPDDVEHALRLARALTASGRGADAIEVLEEAARLGPDPRVTLSRAMAELTLSRYKSALADARRSVEAGTRSGARILTAQGRMLEGEALLRLGDHRAATAAIESARKLFSDAGDRNAEARVLNRLANVAFEEGDYARAAAGFEAAAERHHRVGNVTSEVKALHNLADAWEMAGDLAAARPLFERALDAASALGDPLHESMTRSNLGYLLLLQGDPRAADAQVRRGLEIARESGSGYPLLVALYVSGRVATETADLPRARAAYAEAARLAQQIGERRFGAYAAQGLGDVARASGDPAEARRQVEQALATRRAIDARSEVAESLTALAALSRDLSRRAEAQAHADEAIALCRRIAFRDGELAAWTERLRNVTGAADARPEERAAAAAVVRGLAERTQNVLLRLQAALALADAETGPVRADAVLRVQEEARGRGLLLIAKRAADTRR